MTPDQAKKWTTWGMVILVVLIIAWDVVLGLMHADTESMIIAHAARASMALPFFAGVLMGHWFLNRRQVDYGLWPWAVAALVVVGLWDVLWTFWLGAWVEGFVREWLRWPGTWVVVGLPVGSYLWPQRRP